MVSHLGGHYIHIDPRNSRLVSSYQPPQAKLNIHVDASGYWVLDYLDTGDLGCVTEAFRVEQCSGSSCKDTKCPSDWERIPLMLGDYQHTLDVGAGELCLSAIPADTITGTGSLSMRSCEDGNLTQVWLESELRQHKTMVSKQDDGSDKGSVCLSTIQAGSGVQALTYSHSNCLPGFRSPGSNGDYWLVEDFMGQGKFGCVAAADADQNFYLAQCGDTPGSCATASVPGHPGKKCVKGWRHKETSAAQGDETTPAAEDSTTETPAEDPTTTAAPVQV